MTAVEDLTRALVNLAAVGGSVPCGQYDERELWFSVDPSERKIAIARCFACRLLNVCDAAADEQDERWGVWGGIDRTRAPKRGRRAA